MIVADFHATNSPFIPFKAHPPLIVDAYAPLSGTLAFQCLQPIVRRDTQIFDTLRVVQHTQLAPRHVLNLARQTARKFAAPDLESFFVVEVRNHGEQYCRCAKVLSRGFGELGLGARKNRGLPPLIREKLLRS